MLFQISEIIRIESPYSFQAENANLFVLRKGYIVRQNNLPGVFERYQMPVDEKETQRKHRHSQRKSADAEGEAEETLLKVPPVGLEVM